MPYKDKEKKKEHAREYYKKNKEKMNKISTDYRLNHRERCNEICKKYRDRNPKKRRKVCMDWAKNNPEKSRIIQNRWRNKERRINSSFNIKVKLRGRLYVVLRKYSNTGKIMKSKEYEIDYDAIITHLKPFPKDLSKFHVDHIQPLASFDLNDPEQIKLAFAPENHQWLTIQENLTKSDKIETVK